jgi:3-hydroxybutyryl-CoA dehydrogenase
MPGTTPEEVHVWLIGLGPMGTSIAACLLSAGRPVRAVERDASRRKSARSRVPALLAASSKEGLLTDDPSILVLQFAAYEEYSPLEGCQLVIESATEDLQIKRG